MLVGAVAEDIKALVRGPIHQDAHTQAFTAADILANRGQTNIKDDPPDGSSI